MWRKVSASPVHGSYVAARVPRDRDPPASGVAVLQTALVCSKPIKLDPSAAADVDASAGASAGAGAGAGAGASAASASASAGVDYDDDDGDADDEDEDEPIAM